jgi:hypothetical protein
MMLDLSENALAISTSAFPKNSTNTMDRHKVIAFDPGMRTSCIGCHPDGIIVEVGKSDISGIYRLCYSYDDLQSKWSQPTTKHSNTNTKTQEQGCDVAFEIRLMNFIKK